MPGAIMTKTWNPKYGILLITFPLQCGIPKGHCLTAPSTAAIAKLEPVNASGDDFSAETRSRQRSRSGDTKQGNATTMQRKHQAAASWTETLGWRPAASTASRTPRKAHTFYKISSTTTNYFFWEQTTIEMHTQLKNSYTENNIKQRKQEYFMSWRWIDIFFSVLANIVCSSHTQKSWNREY